MITHGFKLLNEIGIEELKSLARLYRHEKTGAELLSLINEDENKVFGITFRTPPEDSTGVAHILEHSVLCGSRKYPIKEPFVEILKGSLQTFLNAFTYPDRTCYPVASQNLRDFYNLIDVYLDAVFYPRITAPIFQQEGWHYSMNDTREPLRYQGVVYSEMKGVYSSPDSLLGEAIQQSLFPDTTYGFDSGGDPEAIPGLTYEQFREFHRRHYHPSNARVFFSGDDDPDERLRLINIYLEAFEPIDIDSAVPLQSKFREPRTLTRFFASGAEDRGRGMVCLNWLLDETTDLDTNIALNILAAVLLGMPGAPLRKALIESGLGEDIVGGGLEDELRQMTFSVGMKGVSPENFDAVESLVLETLSRLSENGIDPDAIEAALNTLEFRLRENNTGSYPRGLVLMLRAMSSWIYGADPLAPLAFEALLARFKKRLGRDKRFLESLIRSYLLENPHRTKVILKPDPELARERERREHELLSERKKSMTQEQLEEVTENTKRLRELQETPDSPEALRTIPSLAIEDMEKSNKTIPLSVLDHQGVPILYHDLFTSGIAYIDAGFDMRGIPSKYFPYIPLFSRALLEIGTEKEDYVKVLRRIGRKTGGINASLLVSMVSGGDKPLTKLVIRGKAMISQVDDLFAIMEDVLTTVRLDNRERFRQMVLEERARLEQRMIPAGHQVVGLRLRSRFNEADRISEDMGGVSYLRFIRKLIRSVERDWPSVLAILGDIKELMIKRGAMLLNVTTDEEGWKSIEPAARRFVDQIPEGASPGKVWRRRKPFKNEGLVVPSQVNYVGKGADLYRLGYRYHGSAGVITRYLRNSWLWDRVRVQGGAYGAFCLFDRLSGVLAFLSYRDPNLLRTISVFDEAAMFLRKERLTKDEVEKAIIGAIGDMDGYQFPDAKGYTSMVRYLAGITEEERQIIRDQVLATTAEDFQAFAGVLSEVARTGHVTVMGSEDAIRKAQDEGGPDLELVKVL
ncbi:MAG: insulinase family protein [Syntrophales bacterium]|nr:insulinase family protein [Syntrophales bacterium]